MVIVGAGASGISVASSLKARKSGLEVAIIDPADAHYYQPGWTMVGGGIFRAEETVRTMESLVGHLTQINFPTLGIGAVSIGFLFWIRTGLRPVLLAAGMRAGAADFLAKAGPVVAVAATTLVVWGFGLTANEVQIVGAVPQSLPPLTWPDLSVNLLSALFVPALLISIIGFVESISVAQTLATKRRQRIDPDQELIGLGAANIGASLTGGFPVTGGFSRSVVNFDAGAQTPAAGAFTAIGLAISALFLTPLIYFLPKATLAATIIVAILSLVDFQTIRQSWAYSKRDFGAVAVTMLLTLAMGVELGVTAGVLLSILLFLYDTSRPYVAEVGLVPGTQHFRNIHRHEVETDPTVLSLRIDQSLYFANARFLEDHIYDRVIEDKNLKHVILMCSAVNEIDFSAVETLEMINVRLTEIGINLSLSEVKGPVMDRLGRGNLLDHLSGSVYLSQYDAFEALRLRKEAKSRLVAQEWASEFCGRAMMARGVHTRQAASAILSGVQQFALPCPGRMYTPDRRSMCHEDG